MRGSQAYLNLERFLRSEEISPEFRTRLHGLIQELMLDTSSHTFDPASMDPSTLATGTQAKLLRVLQERQVRRVGGQHLVDIDIRVIAASRVHLRAASIFVIT